VRVYILGSDGQLGHELCGVIGCFAEVLRATETDFDMTDAAALAAAIRGASPDVILNAAAYTDVDRAEREPERARKVNADAVGVLAEVGAGLRCPIVHYSTDFVFDGEQARPYTEDDAPHPLNMYGQTKLEGERVLLASGAPAVVLRTAWVYSMRARSFVSAMLKLAREREDLRVVDDQVGNPTFCRELAEATAMLLFGARTDPYAALAPLAGIYHLAGTGSCSRFELASAVIAMDPRKREHKVRHVEPIPTSSYPLPALRPATVSLDCSKAFRVLGLRLPPWRDSLARALAG
jgi:dTDP-4-dehydrorhamnose reductase